ncbi:unnamed protein product [Oppiella nova]|uniref:Uncharacterized protein n=1 Tax=Oppiella nova TaxID=334625 RepID=A0A7R9M7W5_9ACAR|nr:unnamed protein product [Oppiella nova]CAG2172262.1 unnamed protein product [Oppiella nova]
MAYIIYTCGTGGAPVLNGILSWKGWQPISKLTYQACLIHLLEYISGFHIFGGLFLKLLAARYSDMPQIITGQESEWPQLYQCEL